MSDRNTPIAADAARQDAGVVVTRRSDGMVEVSGLPKPRWSNPNLLTEELADWQRQRTDPTGARGDAGDGG